ncbi:structural maintenance of chromosomes protein 2-like [Denticeps clupeoides]|uniref:structural maintenance of chromosomes protein 2-like n=1 Tax=Denticeps clupeoides TaxID=299321 RepID=UPI0010A2AA34|nr:structural maintenance of chromosomes protein 2-like [Denticeps clupeoides]
MRDHTGEPVGGTRAAMRDHAGEPAGGTGTAMPDHAGEPAKRVGLPDHRRHQTGVSCVVAGGFETTSLHVAGNDARGVKGDVWRQGPHIPGRVNKDFSSIFSTLLPGADARLAPPEGFGVLDGLEFKVALGSTWKENLTELSGGQRSLVALSLILAMLLFKPAPIYILDEVDAALDLSHTQNIGQMLRTHFKHSQFVVVSLKDGMFTTSTVTWTAQLQDGKGQAQKSQEKEKVKDKKQRQILKKKKNCSYVCMSLYCLSALFPIYSPFCYFSPNSNNILHIHN